MAPIETILEDTQPFLEKLFSLMHKDGFDLSDYYLDHVAYRVETVEKYEDLKSKISDIAELLSENQIAGRPIAIFRLKEPITYKDRKIEILELPAPKPTGFYKEGWQHAEFVIDIPFDEFMNKYPDIEFYTGALDKEINPELARKYEGVAVKFHHQPVIETI